MQILRVDPELCPDGLDFDVGSEEEELPMMQLLLFRDQLVDALCIELPAGILIAIRDDHKDHLRPLGSFCCQTSLRITDRSACSIIECGRPLTK